MKGKLIVLYGVNNLGKSTQAKLLVQQMKNYGIKSQYVKYAHYGLEPSGPILNDYLRSGNPHNLSPREFQIIQVLNRTQYEEHLIKMLYEGVNIVAEDYVGTGIAWGVGAGVDKNFLVNLNKHLLKEDIAFHFVGKRFVNAIEQGHAHETNDELTERVRVAHEELAKENGWIKIDANQSIEKVLSNLWNIFYETLPPGH